MINESDYEPLYYNIIYLTALSVYTNKLTHHIFRA